MGQSFSNTPIEGYDKKECYTHEEVLEVLRQCLYTGNPGFYEGGGVTGVVNYPYGGTYRKAEESFKKYYLKIKEEKHEH